MASGKRVLRCLEALVSCIVYTAILAPARVNAGRCDEVAGDTAWAECVQRRAGSADARLNSVYQRVIDKLRDDVDAVKHVRNAQRRWVAFRDSQCELEGLSSSIDNVRSQVISNCKDRITARRSDRLFSMLICKDGDLACLKPANGDALSPTARTDGTRRPLGATSSGIPFESPDIIEKFKVSGMWFPEQTKSYVGLSGPAIFVFSNVETRETFSAGVNGVALLSEDYWEKHGASGPDGLDVLALVDKLRAAGVIKIPLSPETRAKVISCDSDARRSAEADSQGEKCLQLGSAAVDIQDVDFDGKKEFVFRQAGESQRGVDAYKVMKLPFDKYLQGRSLEVPLSELDQMSDIDISKRQIVLRESNGACASAILTYALDPKNGSEMRLVKRKQYSSDLEGTCYIENYIAIQPSNGKGYYLKLVSRKPVT